MSGKKRETTSITMDPDIKATGHAIAKDDHRTFSNLLERLITEEEKRRKKA